MERDLHDNRGLEYSMSPMERNLHDSMGLEYPMSLRWYNK